MIGSIVQPEPRGDAIGVIVKGMGLERGDRLVEAEWGQPFVCPTTGNTVTWIQRPGYEWVIKVTYRVEMTPAFKPLCGIAAEDANSAGE